MKVKRFSPYFAILLFVVDFIVCYVAIQLTWFVRFALFTSPIDQVDNFVLSIIIPNIQWYLIILILILLYIFKLYRGFRHKSLFSEMVKLFYCLLLFTVILTLYFLMTKEFESAKLYIIILVVTLFIFLAIERAVLRILLRFFRKKGYNTKFIIIIGINPLTRDFLTRIKSNPSWGFQVLGYFESAPAEFIKIIPYLGNFEESFTHIAKKSIDEIVISLRSEDEHLLPKFIAYCEKEGKQVKIIPSFYQYFPSIPRVEDILGLPIIQTRPFPLNNTLYRIIKRCFDILFASILIIILSPLLLLIALLVKLSSQGPIFFKQMRTGFHNEEFYILKFRSMSMSADADTKMATKDDPRKTKTGNFLRKYNLDELPQLFNILKGDMSFVGPRPHMVSQTKDFYGTYNNYLVRHWVKPGLTGWAQVNGFRGNSSIQKRLKYDIYYIENWSLFFDIRIIFLTLTKSFFDKNAY